MSFWVRLWSAFMKVVVAPVVDGRRRIMTLAFILCCAAGVEAYHGLGVSHLPLALVDFDQSQSSRALHSLLLADPLVSVDTRSFESPSAARQALVRGEVGAVLLIPHDFSTSLKRGRPAHLQAVIDGSNILIAKNLYKSLVRAAVSVGAAVSMVKAEELGVPRAAALSTVMPLGLVDARPYNPAANYAVYVVPGLTFFLLGIYVTLFAAALHQPRLFRGGTVERLGGHLGVFIWGALLAALLLHVALPYDAIHLASGWLVTSLAVGAFLIAVQLLTAALHLCLPAPPLAMDACVFLAMLSLMASGVTFPVDHFPRWVEVISRIVPLQPFAQALQVFLHRPTTLAELAPEFRQLGWQCLGFGSLVASASVSRAFMARKPFRRSS